MKNKILYITEIDERIKIGGMVNSIKHLELFTYALGNRIQIINLCGNENGVEQNQIIVKKSSSFEKIISVIIGYPAYISLRARRIIFTEIESGEYSFVYIDNSISGKLVESIKKRYPQIRVVCFYHDIEKVLLGGQWRDASIKRKFNILTMKKKPQFIQMTT